MPRTIGTKSNEFFSNPTSLNAEEHALLNDAVNEATAFGCWKKMREAMEGGYIPTLRIYEGKGNAAHNRAVRVIREHLNNRGWPHFSDGVCVNY